MLQSLFLSFLNFPYKQAKSKFTDCHFPLKEWLLQWHSLSRMLMLKAVHVEHVHCFCNCALQGYMYGGRGNTALIYYSFSSTRLTLWYVTDPDDNIWFILNNSCWFKWPITFSFHIISDDIQYVSGSEWRLSLYILIPVLFSGLRTSAGDVQLNEV